VNRIKDNRAFQIVVCFIFILGFIYLEHVDSEILNVDLFDQESIEEEMNNIYEQVAMDEIQKFKIVLKSGDKVAICVQAGMVCAALLQAGKESEYLEWKKIEKELCDY
tara:strand:+ start:335 stop:658 length:324 start_codon:yes stop_codon:yes gene_type:complete